MSGGNQQKVIVARWARTSRSVLILDEPTRGVDVGAKTEIYRIMRGLAERGIAILMISSELPEVVGMSDRVVVMREGVISGELDRSRHHRGGDHEPCDQHPHGQGPNRRGSRPMTALPPDQTVVKGAPNQGVLVVAALLVVLLIFGACHFRPVPDHRPTSSTYSSSRRAWPWSASARRWRSSPAASTFRSGR